MKCGFADHIIKSIGELLRRKRGTGRRHHDAGTQVFGKMKRIEKQPELTKIIANPII